MKKYAVIAFGMKGNENGWTLLPAFYSLELTAQNMASHHERVNDQPTKVVEVSAFLHYTSVLPRFHKD